MPKIPAIAFKEPTLYRTVLGILAETEYNPYRSIDPISGPINPISIDPGDPIGQELDAIRSKCIEGKYLTENQFFFLKREAIQELSRFRDEITKSRVRDFK